MTIVPTFCHYDLIHWHLPCREEKTNLAFKTAAIFLCGFCIFGFRLQWKNRRHGLYSFMLEMGQRLSMAKFSERHGLEAPEAEINVRADAPQEMRHMVLDFAYEFGLSPSPMRSLLCHLLMKTSNSDNWSEWPNIAGECDGLIEGCPWYDVYDIIEEIYLTFLKPDYYAYGKDPHYTAELFSSKMNRYFRREGIGWQLVDGKIELRGSEIFEMAVHEARAELAAHGKQTASTELHEAIHDLSRRPSPDATGAVHHAMSALECVTRELCGNNQSTLGGLIKQYPTTFPKPLDQAIEKLWGYSSEHGRHIKEGNPPSFEEAELIVGLCGVLCRYLARKLR
ncbi:MAG: hypothetical protein WCD70_04620 [Alphaproteobacteria bacterium]